MDELELNVFVVMNWWDEWIDLRSITKLLNLLVIIIIIIIIIKLTHYFYYY